MSPEQDQNFEADSQRQKISNAWICSNAVNEEDYEFASQTALGQELISPADVVEYVHLQGKGEEDPVAQRRIIDGVTSIVASLRERDHAEIAENKERSLTNDDVERINRVMQDIELQEMAENEVLAEEPDVSDSGDYVKPDYEWDSDIFSIDLSTYTDEEIEKVRNSVGFKAAIEEIQGASYNELGNRLDSAISSVKKYGGKFQPLQLLMLDEYVSLFAEKEAQAKVIMTNITG